MRTETPPPVRLADYQPFPFRIDSVRMLFRLHPSDTRVVTELAIMRTGAKDAPLRLDGEKLALRSIRLTGLALGVDDYTADEESLTVFRPGDAFRLEIETSISPETNTELSGLYVSSGRFCTQCEAEGFRGITYFLDRPDVMATYTTRVEANRAR